MKFPLDACVSNVICDLRNAVSEVKLFLVFYIVKNRKEEVGCQSTGGWKGTWQSEWKHNLSYLTTLLLIIRTFHD